MKEQVTTRVEYDVDKNEIRRYVCRIIHCDVADRVLDDTEFDAGSGVVHRIVYRYSSRGNVSERFEFDGLDELLERHQYFEDEDGEMIKSVFEFENGKKTIKEFAFSDLGLADRAVLSDENCNLTGYETWIFDTNGNIITEIETDQEGSELSRYEKEYDEHDQLLRESHFVEGAFYQEELFTYNLAGQLTGIVKKDQEGYVIERELMEYNANGKLLIKRGMNAIQEDNSVEECTYDNSGNLLLNRVFVNGRLVFENKCAYDEQHRLISEEIMETDGGGRVVKHEKLLHVLTE